jgi:hypothetical protein
MNYRIHIFFLCLLIHFPMYPQESPVDLEPEQYFDFWIGEWELTWNNADGTEGAGKNVIRKILNGKVLEENFTATGGQYSGFEGKSWSVYDKRTGTWKQTWVDNYGGYLDFTGEPDGEKRIFKREGIDPTGKPILQRMVFHDIANDSLTWDWEVSFDKGEAWTLRWRIFYQRVK